MNAVATIIAAADLFAGGGGTSCGGVRKIRNLRAAGGVWSRTG